MPAMQRLAAPALAALLACALAAPEPHKTFSSSRLHGVKGYWKDLPEATKQGPKTEETFVPLAPKANIITSTEIKERESTTPDYKEINDVPLNYTNHVHTTSGKDNYNPVLQSQTKPNSDSTDDATLQIPNSQNLIPTENKITYPTDKSEDHVNTEDNNKINPNKITTVTLSDGNDSSWLSNPSNVSIGNGVNRENIEPGREGQMLPLFQDALPVNVRFPHAVLFGGTCGGSIISAKWILTAGHCTLFTGGRFVLAGTNRSDDGSGVTVRVKKLHVHPLFTVGPYWLDADRFEIKQVAARWDFMLVELEQPLVLDGVAIAAIPLEDSVSVAPETPVGYAGYGTDHHGGTMRMEMHEMDLKIKPDSTCKKLYQYSKRDMLCAQGYSPKFDSACNGDSGSGLVGNGKLVGVTSWVENDATECRNGNLVVFSKVAAVRQWIRDVAKV